MPAGGVRFFGYADLLTVQDLGDMGADKPVAARAVPTATVADRDLYPNVHAKAAALMADLLVASVRIPPSCSALSGVACSWRRGLRWEAPSRLPVVASGC
jgi:hypothetical protein